MARPKIRCQDVWRVFDGPAGPLVALQEFTLDVAEGEFLCVLGPSGCGKSTLLNLLAGLLRPTRGVITVEDAAVTGPGPERAYVFQEYALFPWMRVRDNVAFGLESRGVRREEREAVAEAILASLGLQAFASAYPHTISGGMKQRVSIARALAVNPEIILMDEPFAALDAQTRFALQMELITIWETLRKTIVFITHNVEEAILLADRIVMLSPQPGRITDVVPVPLSRPREVTDAAYVALLKTMHGLMADVLKRRGEGRYDELARILHTGGAA